jgi:PPP family 3-phenylpropionic acid transporter
MTEATNELERSIRGLNWTYTLIGAADATLLPYIPLYLAERHLDVFEIGVVLAIAAAGWFIAGLLWAYLADRTGKPEGAVIAASAAAGVASLVIPLSSSAVGLGAVIAILFIARSPFSMLDPITLQRLRETSRTRYARIRLRMSGGWALSAVISGAAYQVAGLRLMPFVYAVMVAVFGLWAWRTLRPARSQPAPVTPTTIITRRGFSTISLAMLGFSGACLLLGVSSAAAQNFVTLRINFLGGGALLIGAAAAFQAVTEIPTMGFTHVLTRRFSNGALFAIGSAIFVAVFLAWAVVTNPVALALLRFVTGVGFALTYVAAVLITDELWPARLRATGQVVIKSVMFGLAPIAGNFGGGYVYDTFGPGAMFVVSAVLMGAAGAAAMLAVRRRVAGPKAAAPVAPIIRPEPVAAALEEH